MVVALLQVLRVCILASENAPLAMPLASATPVGQLYSESTERHVVLLPHGGDDLLYALDHDLRKCKHVSTRARTRAHAHARTSRGRARARYTHVRALKPYAPRTVMTCMACGRSTVLSARPRTQSMSCSLQMPSSWICNAWPVRRLTHLGPEAPLAQDTHTGSRTGDPCPVPHTCTGGHADFSKLLTYRSFRIHES